MSPLKEHDTEFPQDHYCKYGVETDMMLKFLGKLLDIITSTKSAKIKVICRLFITLIMQFKGKSQTKP